MKKVRIILPSDRYSDAEFYVYVDVLTMDLVKNTEFKTIGDLSTKLDAANKAFKVGIDAKESAVKLKDKRDIVTREFKMLAATAAYESNGDVEMVLRAGFEIQKDPIQPMKKDLSVEHSLASGSVNLSTKPQRKRVSYLWQYCPDPMQDGHWAFGGVSVTANCQIQDLVPGKYWFRVAVVNGEGQQPFSDPHLMYVI